MEFKTGKRQFLIALMEDAAWVPSCDASFIFFYRRNRVELKVTAGAFFFFFVDGVVKEI